MAVRGDAAEPAPLHKEVKFYGGEDARSGEIILRTQLQRALFIAGLAGAVMLAVLISLLAFGALT